ncbi:MAG: hypothetical protein HS104_12390 [Polyangiaceae bacterium]|nr:hypothetical protein [Polyangiaceae bacterium]MCL4751973.1 hypothetical protein [Myxococcales bacterium]
MRKHQRPAPRPAETDLLARARRHRRRGEHRRAMLVMREACYRVLDDARLWTLYAVACVRAGRRDEAVSALKQAVWLRERDRHVDKARVTLALLAGLLAGDDAFRVAAA